MGADLDKVVVVGHRGTGKSSLLKRWKTYFPELTFADLDEEIEKKAGISVSEVFNTQGEAHFRKLEQEVWNQIQDRDVISVGGGFNLDWISQDRNIFWARRDSDSPYRIFLDRPALSDYPKRFSEREARFQKKARFIYTMPEGLIQPDEEEKRILAQDFKNLGGAITNPRIIFPDSLIEVRDDLEPHLYETPHLLYSVRIGHLYPPNAKVDWDIKNPPPAGLKPYILSSHGNSSSGLEKYEHMGTILKFCPEVQTWKQLKEGFQWQQKNSAQRVFLPRSENGRWGWFRLYMKGRQKLNFWREGSGSANDQPTLWEWMSHPDSITSFAAVLGAPVKHSHSPAFHKNFFKHYEMPFYKIHIEESEWPDAFNFLEELGLQAAAVTAPLKKKAGEQIQKSALNTLVKSRSGWQGISTDIQGAKELLQDYLNESIVVWGGGGVLEALNQVIPKASYYSSRNALPREGSYEIQNPDVLVWGDPHDSINRVPESWSPKVVVDLSYHDQSPARTYAMKLKTRYVSGLSMFTAQAKEQQKFWESKIKG